MRDDILPAMPACLLVATDMGPRCDRALDRTRALQQQWRAAVHVVHAIDPDALPITHRAANALPSWHQPRSDLQAHVERLTDDLADAGLQAETHVREGAPPDVVRQVADLVQADLVITGVAAGHGALGYQMGGTVDTLLRESGLPVLNVRRRARHAYRHVVVATDFSDASAHALVLAATWFGDARLTLFHAYETRGSALAPDAQLQEAWRLAAQQRCDRFMAEQGSAVKAHPWDIVLERGHPEHLLDDFVRHAGVDLVILGTQARSPLMKVLLGSTATEILHRVDCDALIVRGR